MRTSHSTQSRFDCVTIPEIVFNLNCRHEIIPVLVALQYIYGQPDLRDEILKLVAQDVNANSSSERGRKGLQYWQILVLAAVREGCNLDYDQLQDLAENHNKLRFMMGIGDWDDTSFNWKRIHDNVCLLKPETIEQISHCIVAAGHRLDPEAAKTARADSFVMETNIHYPTESSLIDDGTRKIIELSASVALDLDLPGWRQYAQLRKKIKNLTREIGRVAASKNPDQKKMKRLYKKLLKRTLRILERAEKTVSEACTSDPAILGQIEQIRVFIERTRQVGSTAWRRVIAGETVPNEDKLFSIFEPHTQLYRRGKAGQENQFGRLVLLFEDGAGFITHHYLMARDELDKDVAVPQTSIVQERLDGAMETISFDRGFHSEENEAALPQVVPGTCLPKKGPKQYAEQMQHASLDFRRLRQRHSGVESAIGALQSGNGLDRCRDRTETGFARYLSLGILGRNLHVLGKLLIANTSPSSHAAASERKSAA